MLIKLAEELKITNILLMSVSLITKDRWIESLSRWIITQGCFDLS